MKIYSHVFLIFYIVSTRRANISIQNFKSSSEELVELFIGKGSKVNRYSVDQGITEFVIIWRKHFVEVFFFLS